MYKTVVVGRGLIGSAAGRHLAESADGIAIVGPDEPVDRGTHSGVFASHYDEGRMTRVVDPDQEWSITAKRSIQRYPELERRSGIGFFTAAGYLGIGSPQSDYNQRCELTGTHNAAVTERLDAKGIRIRYPYLSVAADSDGLVESADAGYISPRAMVKAQSTLARQAGADLINEVVSGLRPVHRGVEIQTSQGSIIKTEKVLIATGAFTSACGFSSMDLGLKVFARTVVLVRIEDCVLAELSVMPTIIHCESGAYILPPILYPDGHHYLKIGIGTDSDERLFTLQDLNRWFKSSGSDANRHEFKSFLTTLIPILAHCRHWHTDTCAITETQSGLPHIDFIHEDKIALAVGGNGKGAKGADDWGLIAARMILKEPWDHPVARDRLRIPS